MINNVSDLVNNMTPDIYKQLKRVVELGKWPTGEKMSKEQSALCLQAVIAYEENNLLPENRTGYIAPKKHTHCGSTKGEVVLEGNVVSDEAQPLTFK
jgi:uncharacterized protein YeaC (DUF1315 family)